MTAPTATSPGRQRLREQAGFTRVWSAAAVSGFGSYITTLAAQVLIELRRSPHHRYVAGRTS